ncbi:ACP S-malonyltransferase [Anaerovorax odorimutans]|uniref:Malonyl CoA-acyl carrier protein transacylase n=1 Tax=Anaerovorax odorimutans TaxID=109327 RepID=A0ABT1RMR9_9FIRM|nr:ACP S-malonyltransferase [Anaerovorax odorimutans]MCQ4636490.1 ACP S-malonyltransferase [Anaerovorax odorimutans]
MKIGITFAGQGAQYKGMGKDLYDTYESAKEIFDMAGDQVKEWCFEGDEETLKQTHVTQPCIYTVTMAAYKAFLEALKKAGMEDDVEIIGYAGFSLGEYAALTAAGAIDEIKKGMEIVTKRGQLMNEAGLGPDGNPRGAMAAGMGKREAILEVVEEVREDGILEGVNFNSPAQTVVAGDKEAIERFVKAAKAKKIRAMVLPVGTAFHSPMMVPAAKELKNVLKEAGLKAPGAKIYANVTAEDMMKDFDGTDPVEYLADIMSRQAMSPVYWEETIRNFKRDGAEVLVEIGPGKTLSGLAKKTDPAIARFNIENAESLQQTIEGLTALKEGE